MPREFRKRKVRSSFRQAPGSGQVATTYNAAGCKRPLQLSFGFGSCLLQRSKRATSAVGALATRAVSQPTPHPLWLQLKIFRLRDQCLCRPQFIRYKTAQWLASSKSSSQHWGSERCWHIQATCRSSSAYPTFFVEFHCNIHARMSHWPSSSSIS